MSIKKDEKNAAHSITSIPQAIDAEATCWADYLDNNKIIYYFFALADGISCSYGTFKYAFDAFVASFSSLTLHEILSSPAVILGVVLENIFLISYCFLAKYLERDENTKKFTESAKNFVISSWDYVRDFLKGIKNSFRALKMVLQVSGFFTLIDPRIFLGVGIFLSVFAALNRMLQSYIKKTYKEKKKEYINLRKSFLKIDQLMTLTELYKQIYKEDGELLDTNKLKKSALSEKPEKPIIEILPLTFRQKILGYTVKGLGGFFDGVYLFGGLITLASFASPLFITVAAVSGFYIAFCVLSRLFEEYDEQLSIKIQENKTHLAFYARSLELKYNLYLQLITTNDPEKANEIAELKANLLSSLKNNRWSLLVQQQKKQRSLTYAYATIMGMRYGLVTYAVLASGLFMLSTIGVVFPPAIIFAAVLSGLAFMALTTSFTVYKQHQFLKQTGKSFDFDNQAFSLLKNEIENNIQNHKIDNSQFDKFIKYFKKTAKSPLFKYRYQQWIELLRVVFSGIGKGFNSVNFFSMMSDNWRSNQHDSPVYMVFLAISAVFFSVVLFLRAFANGLKPNHSRLKVPKSLDSSSKIIEEFKEKPPSTKSSLSPPEKPSKESSLANLPPKLPTKPKRNSRICGVGRFFSKKSTATPYTTISLSANTTPDLK